jgi:hypothetical protein
MEKQQLISLIQSQIAEGKISKEDLSQIISAEVVSAPVVVKEETSKKLIDVFYAIGGIIAVIGVIILVAQNWAEIGLLGRIFVTLGISVATYVIGLLVKDEEKNVLSQIMFLISSVLAPVGVSITLDEFGIEFTATILALVSVCLAVLYGFAFWDSTKRRVLVLISAIFAAISVFALASETDSTNLFLLSASALSAVWAGVYAFVISKTKMHPLMIVVAFFGTVATYFLSMEFFADSYNAVDYFKWLTILVGASYILLSSNIENQNNDRDIRIIKNIFYGIGTLAVLGTGISFGGVFDLILILVIFGFFYASVYFRSSLMLLFSALFLISHILKITSEYFSDSVNWAVMLIFIGFLIIGIGYTSFYLNKKYISQK